MNESCLSVPERLALWAAGLLLGGHITVGDVYLGLLRALAEANIQDDITLALVETLLNQWTLAGVVGAGYALAKWRKHISS